MTVLYVATFGSFIGFSSAFPLLLKLTFPEFVKVAFLGALLAATARAVGGWLSDKFGGGLVTTFTLVAMAVGCAFVIYFYNQMHFPGFLIACLTVFIAAGLGSASTFQMIPSIFPEKEAAPVLGFTASFAAYGSYLIPKLFGWSTDTFGTPVNAVYFFIGFYLVSIVLHWFYYRRNKAEIKVR